MPLVRVLAGEYVVAHGTSTTAWSVHSAGRWVPIGRCDGVTSERVSAGPGTVWQTLFELAVPEGSWLLRIDTAPAPRHHTDPFRYLEREVRGGERRITRRYYRVGRQGGLSLAPRSQAPN
jgi:hypothetical protein